MIEGKKKSRAFLEFRPYSAFNFGGRNRKLKAENFPFRPKVSASGIPLLPTHIPYPDNLPIHINSVPYFQEQDILQPYMFMEIMIMIKALKELKTYLAMKSLPNGSRMVNMRIMLALSMSGDHWIIQLKNVHWVMLILIR